jgi:ubiquinone/menaquinone biosynthesis C-methylase UbiE
MKNSTLSEINIQRDYYKKTSNQYNKMHTADETGEHFFALSCLAGLTDYLKIKSILDVGAGTGRSIKYLKKICPKIKIIGIEPVKELREIAYAEGISRDELIDGDATNINFKNLEFDLVCEFGVLHHIKNHKLAVDEMLRVSKKGIFISDTNNFAQGSIIKRSIKQILHTLRLWKFVYFVKTKGKGYTFSEGDGLAYSYSIFENYKQIKSHCSSVHIINTLEADINLYRTATHIALLGIKRINK